MPSRIQVCGTLNQLSFKEGDPPSLILLDTLYGAELAGIIRCSFGHLVYLKSIVVAYQSLWLFGAALRNASGGMHYISLLKI